MEIGFIGLGSMGLPIAKKLRKARHNLTVYNRSLDKAEAFVKDGGRLAKTAVEAAQGDIVFSVLADDHAVEAVFFAEENGKSMIERHAPHTVHVSLSTISVRLADLCKVWKAHG
ncbi:MAG: NAD(P)-binding domain-containing protein [Cyanobacteria bacterium REEB67]|nr:NAD(P)-binding domain-containing protein [Cyanobacteria bacterium REEB67]